MQHDQIKCNMSEFSERQQGIPMETLLLLLTPPYSSSLLRLRLTLIIFILIVVTIPDSITATIRSPPLRVLSRIMLPYCPYSTASSAQHQMGSAAEAAAFR